MEFHKQKNLVKAELMKYAMCCNINEFKKVFYQNNEYFGKNGEWMILCDIFKYSCKIMSVKLLDALYEIYEKIDSSIGKENRPEIFYNTILYQNTKFYNYLLSKQGPLYVFNSNKKIITNFIINNRYRFIPILESLNNKELNMYIQNITEDAVTTYDENIIRVEDKEYTKGDYVFMEFETIGDSKKVTHIPISIKDAQYIRFLEELLKN
jgi:hypothetical protein